MARSPDACIRTANGCRFCAAVHTSRGGQQCGAPDDYLRKTMEEFKALNPDVLIPMHCSGPSLIALLRSEMSDRVITSTPGTEFVFGA